MTQSPNRGKSSKSYSSLPNLLQEFQVAWQLFRDARVPAYAKYLPALLVLVYILSPIDVIPDFLLGPGQLDDLAIFFLGLALFRALVPEHIVKEYYDQGKSTPRTDTSKKTTAETGDYIDAEYRVLHDE